MHAHFIFNLLQPSFSCLFTQTHTHTKYSEMTSVKGSRKATGNNAEASIRHSKFLAGFIHCTKYSSGKK